MLIGRYVFSQVTDFIPRYTFDECVKRYDGNRRIRQLSCRDQFLSMLFGQLSYRESLRDVSICLGTQKSTLYHLGISSHVARSTLAIANEKRDWRIYRDFAETLIVRAKKICLDDGEFRLNLNGSVYALDSTTIDLCMSVFPWADFRKTKSAVKAHVLFDVRTNIPSFFLITKGKVHDVTILDEISFELGAYYVVDRAYLDFKRLYRIHTSQAFFVIRSKKNTKLQRTFSRKISDSEKSEGIRSDQAVRVSGANSDKRYPERLRRITFFDREKKRKFIFLTNDLKSDAKTICDLYRYRWRVELFFKWIKQHLRIKSFWGRSKNAVKTQICIAICAYALVAIMKKELEINRSMYEILQILSVSLFVKKPLNTLFLEDMGTQFSEGNEKQTCLWDF